MQNMRRARWPEQHGTAVVEAAMTMLGFLVLLLGIFEAGRLFNIQQVLTGASREGARLAVSPLSGTSTLPGPLNPMASANTVRQRVMDYCAERNIAVPSGDITVSQQHPITVGALTVMGSEVTISYTRPFLIAGALFLPGWGCRSLR